LLGKLRLFVVLVLRVHADHCCPSLWRFTCDSKPSHFNI
jgi:hypothetical protein